jgi:hypothetical protein
MSGSDDGRRLFARVEETVGVRVRTLTPAEAARLARCRLAALPAGDEPADVPPPPAGQETWERVALVAILARLDRLERLVQASQRPLDDDAEDATSARWLTGESRTLSGGGLGVLLPERLEPGTPVDVELLVQGETPAAIRAVGRVASCSEGSPPFVRPLLGIAFTAIHPADREALVRYTFRVQRARLRERRRGDDPGPVL